MLTHFIKRSLTARKPWVLPSILLLITECFVCIRPLLANTHLEARQQAVKELIAQMSSAINSRNAYTIKSFFEFYAAPQATFIKSSHVLRSDSPEPLKQVQDLTLDRTQYINFLSQAANSPNVYGFEASMQSFMLTDNPDFAVSSISIREVAIYSRTFKDPVPRKTVINANCNFTFNILSSPPIILGNNCVEEIIVH